MKNFLRTASQTIVGFGLFFAVFGTIGCGKGTTTAVAATTTAADPMLEKGLPTTSAKSFRFDAVDLQKSFEKSLGLQFSVEKFEDGFHAIGRRGGKGGTGPIITIYRVGQNVSRFELIFNPQDNPKSVDEFASVVVSKLCESDRATRTADEQRKSLRTWIADATILLSRAKQETKEFGRHATFDSSIAGVFPASRVFARDRSPESHLPVFKFTFLPGTAITGPLPGDG